MKVMGFDDLVLVARAGPTCCAKEETIQRASSALDVLEKARVVATLDEALDGMSHLCATAMTRATSAAHGGTACALRSAIKTRAPGACCISARGQKRFKPADDGEAGGGSTSRANRRGISVWCERFGMTNEDVYRCHAALSIPTNPRFGSLNLGAAIQVIAYDWRQALGGFGVVRCDPRPRAGRCDAQGAGMLGHWEQALISIGFLDPGPRPKAHAPPEPAFNRAQLTPKKSTSCVVSPKP